MKLKKTFVTAFLILSGVVCSLYNAANEYGLYTNRLHESVAAQSDDTSGETTNGGPCDGTVVLCNSYMYNELKRIYLVSDNCGVLNIFGKSYRGYKKNTKYVVFVDEYSCKKIKSNSCNTRNQKSELCMITESDSTNGDETNVK